MKNHYFVGNDIRDNGVRFRKSHIKRIKLVSCLSINKCYKLGYDKQMNQKNILKKKANMMNTRMFFIENIWAMFQTN